MKDIQKLAIGDATVLLIAAGDRICDHVRRRKGFEPQSRKLWGGWCADVGPSGVVLDVGAYSGLFAIGAALLGCDVIAFEPMPFNADRFADNAVLNEVSPSLRRAAVSDKSGEIDITYNPKIPFTSGASLIRKKGVKLRVQTLTIDSLALPRVDAIKIDVEHGELLVLAGATETLKRCAPKLLVEALSKPERDAILKALPGYWLADVIDVRNLVLLPR